MNAFVFPLIVFKLPNDRNNLKLFLRFLDEGMYLGPFSQQRYITNSKRQV